MPYIRTNEDYYESLGMSPIEAVVQAELDRRGLDSGYCNPIKEKIMQEEAEEIKRKLIEIGWPGS